MSTASRVALSNSRRSHSVICVGNARYSALYINTIARRVQSYFVALPSSTAFAEGECLGFGVVDRLSNRRDHLTTTTTMLLRLCLLCRASLPLHSRVIYHCCACNDSTCIVSYAMSMCCFHGGSSSRSNVNKATTCTRSYSIRAW